MKKSARLALIALLALLTLVFGGCYDGELTDDGRMFIGYSKMQRKAFVGELCGNEEDTAFTLPDEYKGFPVTTLGGYVGRGLPCPFDFSIETPEEYLEYRENQRAFGAYSSFFDQTGDGWETIVFYITLGKNIREIENASPCYYFGIKLDNGDGTYTMDLIYKIVPYFIVPEENKTFYAEEGRLFYKKNGAVAGEFEYE